MRNNTLIGILTYDREDFCLNLLKSIQDLTGIDVMILKDGEGTEYTDSYWNSVPHGTFFKEQKENHGIGFNKKSIMDFARKEKYEHLYLIEDDVMIKDVNVFHYCQSFSSVSGLCHFNWNSPTEALKSPKFSINYDSKGENVASVNHNCSGCFQYFNKQGLDSCDIDLAYLNAWEHVDLEMQLCFQGLIPAFWNFVSPNNLGDMLEMQDTGNRSTITGKDNYESNVANGAEYFIKKWGCFVTDIKSPTTEIVAYQLKQIQLKYGKPGGK